MITPDFWIEARDGSQAVRDVVTAWTLPAAATAAKRLRALYPGHTVTVLRPEEIDIDKEDGLTSEERERLEALMEG